MQTPLFPFDGSEPTFDYYPSHQASTTYIQDPQSQNPYAVDNSSMSEWNTGRTEGMDMLGGSSLGGMDILSLGMNLGGMDSAMNHDANMGMSDWALFDNNEPS